MAEVYVNVSNDPVARIKSFHPKPGDLIWIRFDETTAFPREEYRQVALTLEDAIDLLGLKGQVAIVITVSPHDLSVLNDDEMERLGWVRKKGTP